jgi:beta propeller repeat protein
MFIVLIISILLLIGCSADPNRPSTAKKQIEVTEPSKIEYTFDGFYSEVYENIIVVNNRDKIEVFDLMNGKLIEDIPVSSEFGILGLDIYGDIITWSEIYPQSVENRERRNPLIEDTNVFIYNISTNEKKKITTDKWAQNNPKIWKNYLIWQDNKDDASKEYPGKWNLILYDLATGTEKRIISTLAAHATYNISDDKIVWEDHRNYKGSNTIRGGDNLPENNKDIYMYDIKTGTESAIATDSYMESNPDINGNYIVWEDRNSNTLEADIVLYDLNSIEQIYLTKDKVDQGTPRIYGDYIVWMDERRGISTNDVIINGKEPNSDIVLYHIKNKTERILTGNEPQILPSISSEWVSFTLSRQADPKVQVVRYKR